MKDDMKRSDINDITSTVEGIVSTKLSQERFTKKDLEALHDRMDKYAIEQHKQSQLILKIMEKQNKKW